MIFIDQEQMWRSVEETLNLLLEQEADRLVGARRFERTNGRKDTRTELEMGQKQKEGSAYHRRESGVKYI